MHYYDRTITEGELPELRCYELLRFKDALDIVELARGDRTFGWRTWPEVWHLDEDGRFNCYFKGSSLDTIKGWADDPEPLHRSRLEGLRTGGCADYWVIVDSRPHDFGLRHAVDEGDAAAFHRLRRELADIDVALLDVVVFDDCQHWWSLRELTSGTTRWELSAARP